MSAIRIAKGYPKSFLVRLKNDTADVDLNDGTWLVEVSLHYQTDVGPTPFDITPSVNGLTLQVDLDNTQTSQLSHLGTGYILKIKASKTDNSIFIENTVPVSVTDGL